MAASPRHRCRACGSRLSGNALLCYRDMPAAAQGFPDQASLATDRSSELALFECADCGLVQVPGTPVPYYREVIRATAFSPAMRQFRQGQLADWVARHQLKGKSLLEIGCGRGEYLELLRDAGLQVHGTEYAPASIATCRAAGLAVTRAFIERPSQRLSAGPFDAFASFNFMEHWPAPVASLRGIRANLAEGGLGLIEVPNFSMILEKGLYSEFIADHLSYFTRDTFTHTLQAAGFEVLECNSIWQDYILSATVRKRPSTDLGLIHARRDEVKHAFEAFLDRFPSGRVAVWGAGHQALAAIALAGIAGRIRYVVDSAPFKQGKFTPATHLPIVAPDHLKRDPVDAIIVMAAAYSDEVAGIIREKHGPELELAILRDTGLEICR